MGTMRVHIHWTQFTESDTETGAAALMASRHYPKQPYPSVAGEQFPKLLRLRIDYQDILKIKSPKKAWEEALLGKMIQKAGQLKR